MVTFGGSVMRWRWFFALRSRARLLQFAHFIGQARQIAFEGIDGFPLSGDCLIEIFNGLILKGEAFLESGDAFVGASCQSDLRYSSPKCG